MYYRRLEDVFRVTFFVFQNAFKTCLQDVFLKSLEEDVLKHVLKHLEDILRRRLGKQEMLAGFVEYLSKAASMF